MTTKSRPETPLSGFFDLAKAKNSIIRPHFFSGREGLLIDHAGPGPQTLDYEFLTAIDLYREQAEAALWKQARKITREFRARAASLGYSLTLLPPSIDGPNVLLTPGSPDDSDSFLEENFLRHQHEIAAVMRAEAGTAAEVAA